jgi:hypothetical protein
MGVFFIVFGALKVIKLKAFAEAFAGYDLLAMKSKVYALVYPFIEIALGVLLLKNILPFWTNVMVAVIMLVGALGV